MAIPATPTNVYVQQGNGQVYVSWDISAGATSYPVLRSTDNVTFVQISDAAPTNYTDNTAVVGTQYYYQVQAKNGTGSSPSSPAQGVVPALTGTLSLSQIRLMSQQRADRVNSNFVTVPEWNTYINQSAFELYDLLVNVYEDYFLADPYTFTTDGISNTYALPSNFDKLMGVDLGLSQSNNARVTLHKFDFIERNRYVYPNVTGSFLGVFNLAYRLMGNKLQFIPTPSAGQVMTVWFVPRMTMLLKDTDILDGISGWIEYVITDAAIKALQKEESDVSVLMTQKQMLIKRIEESAMNRDAGQPDTISPTRNRGGGSWGGPGFDGNFGGY